MDNINDTGQAAPQGVGLAVTLAEAGRLLSVSTRTIHRLAAAGRLRVVRITRDTPRVLRADLDALLASGDADVAAMASEEKERTT